MIKSIRKSQDTSLTGDQDASGRGNLEPPASTNYSVTDAIYRNFTLLDVYGRPMGHVGRPTEHAGRPMGHHWKSKTCHGTLGTSNLDVGRPMGRHVGRPTCTTDEMPWTSQLDVLLDVLTWAKQI